MTTKLVRQHVYNPYKNTDNQVTFLYAVGCVIFFFFASVAAKANAIQIHLSTLIPSSLDGMVILDSSWLRCCKKLEAMSTVILANNCWNFSFIIQSMFARYKPWLRSTMYSLKKSNYLYLLPSLSSNCHTVYSLIPSTCSCDNFLIPWGGRKINRMPGLEDSNWKLKIVSQVWF